MSTYTTFNNVDKFFQAKFYLVSMTIYHIIALLFFYYNIKGFKLQTFVEIDQSLVEKSKSVLDVADGRGLVGMLIICTLVIFVDLIFLLILSYDFRNLNLTWNKIYYIETILFSLALIFPLLRSFMLFFSLNTLQIFVFYHIAIYFEKYNISIPRYIIVLGGYILLIKIIFYPINQIYNLRLI